LPLRKKPFPQELQLHVDATVSHDHRPPAHPEIERIFIGTLQSEWRDVALGGLAADVRAFRVRRRPMMYAHSAGMSTHSVLTSIIAAVSSWRLSTRPAVATRAAYAVVEEGIGGGASWPARGPPTAADVVRGDAQPPLPT
jgi:hypothetical protein